MKSGAWLLVGAVLVGCGRGDFNDRKSAVSDTLTYPLEARVTTIDPAKLQDIDMGDVLGNVFEGLVGYDQSNKIVGRLAERWDVEDGGKRFVFHLRDAKFQNGRPVTAEDVLWSWNRALNPAVASPIADGYLGNIVGAHEVTEGKSKSIAGVKVIDAKTLSIQLDQPRPYFLGNLTYSCAYILAKEAAPLTGMTKVAEAVGTGPFKLASVAEDTQVELTAFADYWGGAPKLRRIVRPVVTDGATRLSRFRTGEFDLLGVARQDVGSVQKDPKLKPALRFEPRPAVFYFLVNQKAYVPFRDERVRRAFAMTLDRKKTVDQFLPGQRVANGLVAPGVLGFDESYQGIPHAPDEARKLLAEAGYPNGKGLPTLELSFRASTQDSRLICEAAATIWKKELNAPVQPKALEWSTLLARRNKDDLQMGLFSWYADYLDPQNFLSLLMMSTSKLNHDGYADKQFDAWCSEADVTVDEAKRIDLYRRAERRAIEQAARLPLYFQQQPLLVAPRVKGLRTNLFGYMPHTTVEIGE